MVPSRLNRRYILNLVLFERSSQSSFIKHHREKLKRSSTCFLFQSKKKIIQLFIYSFIFSSTLPGPPGSRTGAATHQSAAQPRAHTHQSHTHSCPAWVWCVKEPDGRTEEPQEEPRIRFFPFALILRKVCWSLTQRFCV